MRRRRSFVLSILTLVSTCLGCAQASTSPALHSPAVAAAPAAPPRARAPEAEALAAPAAVRSSGAASLGQLDFPVTGTPECQTNFREGMLAMHSFEYDRAHESFAAALAADAGCAMAAWGDAMTYEHPIWDERDAAKARMSLALATHREALPPKERDYLAAASALFAKDDGRDAHAAWLGAAERMHRDYPDDDEVALQHALALLSVYGYEPAHVREQMEAGAIALDVLARRPEHPGAAHYAIHAFDTRDHAILALPAARIYARIAPAAGHALHMPSHTFVHLGLWRDAVPSNERAYAASVAWETAHGHAASKYDWHSYSWLVAAHLELGHARRARELIDAARALVVAVNDDDAAGMRRSYAEMVAAYVAATERWRDVEDLVAPVFAPAFHETAAGTGAAAAAKEAAAPPGAGGTVACAAHAPGGSAEQRFPDAIFARVQASVLRAEAALRLGEWDAAEKRVLDAKAAAAQMAPWQRMLPKDFAARRKAIDDELVARAGAGRKPLPALAGKAILALERLARVQSEGIIAGPAFMTTGRELLGEAQLAAGKPREALSQFERDREERPNRAAALLGVARASKAAGDLAAARAAYAALAEQWRDADPDLPALAEVRAGSL
jgi:hypothetical protein